MSACALSARTRDFRPLMVLGPVLNVWPLFLFHSGWVRGLAERAGFLREP